MDALKQRLEAAAEDPGDQTLPKAAAAEGPSASAGKPVVTEVQVAFEDSGAAEEHAAADREPIAAAEEPSTADEPSTGEEPVTTEEPVTAEERTAAEEPVSAAEQLNAAAEEPTAAQKPVVGGLVAAAEDPAAAAGEPPAAVLTLRTFRIADPFKKAAAEPVEAAEEPAVAAAEPGAADGAKQDTDGAGEQEGADSFSVDIQVVRSSDAPAPGSAPGFYRYKCAWLVPLHVKLRRCNRPLMYPCNAEVTPRPV